MAKFKTGKVEKVEKRVRRTKAEMEMEKEEMPDFHGVAPMTDDEVWKYQVFGNLPKRFKELMK